MIQYNTKFLQFFDNFRFRGCNRFDGYLLPFGSKCRLARPAKIGPIQITNDSQVAWANA